MKLKTVKVNGFKCDISVSDDGQFSSRVAGQYVRADTMVELKTKLKKAAKRPKIEVAVPVTVLGRGFTKPQYGHAHWHSGSGVQHVTLVGLGADGDVRYRDDKTGEKGYLHDIRSTWRGEVVRRLTDEEAAEWARLATAARDAEHALRDFEKRVALPESADDLVKAAIGAKEDTPVEPPEESADPRAAGGAK